MNKCESQQIYVYLALWLWWILLQASKYLHFPLIQQLVFYFICTHIIIIIFIMIIIQKDLWGHLTFSQPKMNSSYLTSPSTHHPPTYPHTHTHTQPFECILIRFNRIVSKVWPNFYWYKYKKIFFHNFIYIYILRLHQASWHLLKCKCASYTSIYIHTL